METSDFENTFDEEIPKTNNEAKTSQTDIQKVRVIRRRRSKAEDDPSSSVTMMRELTLALCSQVQNER